MSLLSTLKLRKLSDIGHEHLSAPRPTWPGALRWFSAEFLVVVSGVLVALAVASTAFGRYAVRFLVRHPDTDRISFRLQAVAEEEPSSLPADTTNLHPQ